MSREFIHLLIHIGAAETQIEKTRLLMCENEYFTLYRAFQCFAQDGKITVDHLAKCLSRNEHRVRQFIAQFSDSEVIMFPHFMDMVLPRTDPQLRVELTQKVDKNIDPEKQFVIQSHLNILFQQELKLIEDMHNHSIEIQQISREELQLIFKDRNINIEPIWARIKDKDIQTLLAAEAEPTLTINQLTLPLNKLEFKNSCAMHLFKRKDNVKIELQKFEKHREHLNKNLNTQIHGFLILLKELGQIALQVEQLVRRLKKRMDFSGDLLIGQLCEDGEIDFHKVQAFLGSEFLLSARDINLMTEYRIMQRIQGSSQEFRCQDLAKAVLIKILLLLQMARYLRMEYIKKLLFSPVEIVAQFSQRIHISDVLQMCRKHKVDISLEECNAIIKEQSHGELLRILQKC